MADNFIIGQDDLILITGATGFIGKRVVSCLLDRGLKNLRCFSRPSTSIAKVESAWREHPNGTRLQIIRGNLLSTDDCAAAAKGATVIIHLAAGRGEKSYPDAFMNSVVTTKNLLEAARNSGTLRRFVNVSSFTVYTNENKPRGILLDESCPVEKRPAVRGEAYTFAKVKQEEIVMEYGKEFGLPYVIVRPGVVYGAGNEAITGRVGIGTFGLFLHLGGSNTIPFTYVDNCAEAIALAGLKPGVDGEVFNIVDDDLPSSRKFLRMYKKDAKRFKSVYVPHFMSYFLCYLWERYVERSEGQMPPAFNRSRWNANWRKTRYTNEKLKTRLAWTQTVPTSEGLKRYFESCRNRSVHA
jgi:nucleoside-diphosphate-sugar epimerase